MRADSMLVPKRSKPPVRSVQARELDPSERRVVVPVGVRRQPSAGDYRPRLGDVGALVVLVVRVVGDIETVGEGHEREHRGERQEVDCQAVASKAAGPITRGRGGASRSVDSGHRLATRSPIELPHRLQKRALLRLTVPQTEHVPSVGEIGGSGGLGAAAGSVASGGSRVARIAVARGAGRGRRTNVGVLTPGGRCQR